MDESGSEEVKLPGFRFHPTEEELLNFYLKRMVFGNKLCGDIIGCLNIYSHDPRELPGLAKIGEREWYFFVPRDRKHGSGGRPNRTTEKGFWKATGSDRKILSLKDPKKLLGLKKTLVFYEGRAPRGIKTDWVMNEYRLPDSTTTSNSVPPPKDIVLCKIYRKATSLKALEQRAAMEQEEEDEQVVKMVSAVSCSGGGGSTTSTDSISFCNHQFEEVNATTITSKDHEMMMALSSSTNYGGVITEEPTRKKTTTTTVDHVDVDVEEEKKDLISPADGKQQNNNLAELQLPKFNMDWTQDSFWTQLRSPWLDNFTSFLPLC